ncbi:hypothetical protein SAMN05428957_104117 [Oryzisolibacter propanilivorax]|uniref:Type II secretion system protein K n=1 Tax=Oryzisolibacter propanilivorax TaxID=1527607 RepID=A0A1G9S7E7_9BURK|nr:hypothetical protein [Oryzisolibacter propanilivorax]SDM30695.1 hypothetical protein SAMN05428957_104117 [Oryzisolibacter propanilivorax]
MTGMRKRLPMRRAAARPLRPRGYVLLFVLGLLAVVATVVLGSSVGLRLDTQLLTHEKTRLRQHYALQGAAQEVAAQLAITQAVDALRLKPDDALLRDWPLWRPDAGEQRVRLDGLSVQVRLHDVSGLPDANLLTQAEWQRLLLLAGAANADSAQRLATQLYALRQQLAALRGGRGFTSLQELLQWREIPAALAYGDPARELPGLGALVVVGTGSKRVNLDRTPLPVIQALGANVTPEHLRQLAALRAAGPIPVQQAQLWLQGTGLDAYPPGGPVMAVQARLRMADAAASGSELVALIAGENGRFAVVDQWPDPGIPGR